MSIVRCPLCSAEFRLVEFLAQLPPPLIVVTDAGGPAEEVPDSSRFRAGDTDALGGQAALIDTGPVSDSSEEIPAFDFVPGSVDDDSPSPPRESSRRPARRPKNMAWEMAKIVGGALLAVPAAQIILWWFVPYDWKRDLLGIGPSLSRVVPWAVPDKFRDPFGEDTFDSASLATGDRQLASPLRRPSVAVRDRSTVPPTRGSERPESPPPPSSSPSKTGTAGEPAANQRPITMREPAEPADGVPAAKIDTAPAESEPLVVASDPPPTDLAQTISNATGSPKYGAADLQAALEQALQASVNWDTSTDQTDSHRAGLTDDFYREFAHLGEVLAFMRPDEDRVREWAAAVRDLLLSFGQQPKKLAMIGNRTVDWLDQPTPPNQGVFLFGTVKQLRPEGPLFATELELASLKKHTVTIISRLDPGPFYAPGDRILMLGVLMTSPTEQPAGPKSQAATVVLGSFPIRLP
ncbi:MAG: hypothetical protein ACYC4N_19135 [Pirellulaceae bacterium]